jgi:hypothetical protein
MSVRALPAALTLALLAASGCGTSGDATTRPIETLLYVSGGPGLQFGFAADPDPTACGSNATGIQSPNADHQFDNRIFVTPHLFVLENDRQPVRAAIVNLDDAPIRVDLYLGQTPQQSNVVVNPGECRTVAQTGAFPPTPARLPDVTPAPTPTAVTFPEPDNRGPEVRVEICSPQPTPPVGLTTPCISSSPGGLPPADRNISYFATIGDIEASDITNCILPPILDACRSPSTFFIEQPQQQVDAVLSVNPGQNPDGQPTAEVRAELYVNDRRVDSAAGTGPIVGTNF